MPPRRLHEHIHLIVCRAASRRRRLSRHILSSQHPMRQRRKRHVPNPSPCARRKDRLLRLSPQNRVLRLARRKSRQPPRGCNRRGRINLLRRPLAEPDRSHFARLNSPVQRAHCLFERRRPVVPMALVKIDLVQPQPFERPVQLLLNLRH